MGMCMLCVYMHMYVYVCMLMCVLYLFYLVVVIHEGRGWGGRGGYDHHRGRRYQKIYQEDCREPYSILRPCVNTILSLRLTQSSDP